MWLTNMFLTVIFLQKNECGNDPLIYALHGRRNRGAHPPRLLMTHEIGSLDLIKFFFFFHLDGFLSPGAILRDLLPKIKTTNYLPGTVL